MKKIFGTGWKKYEIIETSMVWIGLIIMVVSVAIEGKTRDTTSIMNFSVNAGLKIGIMIIFINMWLSIRFYKRLTKGK